MTSRDEVEKLEAELREARQEQEQRARERTDERTEELQKTLEDLRLHQEELSAQNHELREARRTLEESRDQYADLYDFAPVGYITLDETGVIRAINLTGAAMLATERAKLLGFPFSPYVARDDRNAFVNHLLECGRSSQKVTTELTLEPKNRVSMKVQLLSTPYLERGRTIYRTVMTDITDRKRSEEELARHHRQLEELVIERTAALSESEERYRRIVETASEGIWMGDRHGTTVFANPVMAEMLGYRVEELAGMSAREFLLEKDREVWDLRSAQHLAGRKQQTEVQLRKKDGKNLWAMASMSPVFDRDGNYLGALAMVTDLTEHRKVEEQFRHSQRLETVGQLAAGIAHEFNNMMIVVTGYSDLVLEKLPRKSPLREKVLSIKECGERAASLTQQLLAFSRKQMLQRRVIDLNETVNHMHGMLHRLLGTDIRLEMRLFPAAWKVTADPSRLEQVILNLAVNARDAMPEGGTLTIATDNVTLDAAHADFRPEIIPGRYTLLSVSDTGVGMDKTTQERIFDPFFTTKEPGKGTGLGLSMVYGTVKQKEGYIYVDSKPDKGSTFKIYLPCAPETAGTSEEETKSRKVRGGSETILLVEDEEPVRTLVKAMLEGKGYRILEASGAEEALNLYACQPACNFDPLPASNIDPPLKVSFSRSSWF